MCLRLWILLLLVRLRMEALKMGRLMVFFTLHFACIFFYETIR